jgi:hypothetical protein
MSDLRIMHQTMLVARIRLLWNEEHRESSMEMKDCGDRMFSFVCVLISGWELCLYSWRVCLGRERSGSGRSIIGV